MNNEEMKKEQEKVNKFVDFAKNELEELETLYKKIDKNSQDEFLQLELSKTYVNKIKKLNKAILIPFFARVDFKEENKNDSDKIYIGRTNIFDEKMNVVVADWRAPISNIYYDGRIGKTEYECPEGIIQGDLLLKRIYDIQNGKLINYNDIDITTNDSMLQECLNENSDARLKNIVTTIQAEQNKIIRSDMFKPLIIQGVAGSGKTTVALHRIAYLVYTYEKQFRPEDFLVIAPNKFFLDYISGVLPDLGVDYVRQETFEQLALDIIDEKLEIEDVNVKLVKIVNNKEDENIVELMKKAAEFKTSINFKELIDICLNNYNDEYLLHGDFMIKDISVIKYEELKEIFNLNKEKVPLQKRVSFLKEYMIKKVENASGKIIEQLSKERRKKIEKISDKTTEEEAQRERRKIVEETEYEIACLLKGGKKLVEDFIKKSPKIKVMEQYKKIINESELMKNYIDKQTMNHICKEYNRRIKNKTIEFEDLAPLLHIKHKLVGSKENFDLRHIVIDEAQDFGEFQFYALNEILNNNKSMTILGDIAQGIYSYKGTKNWKRINDVVFKGEAVIENMDKSYRTTIEIMNEANKVIEPIKAEININLAIPVSRHGKPVQKVDVNTFEETISYIDKRIKELLNEGLNNIAIICKDTKRCNLIFEAISKENGKVELITENVLKYNGGITIIPVHLSKGLEFDSVLITDYNLYDNSILERQLLYVACTRAMHTLDILK